jgi:hypothetical protein
MVANSPATRTKMELGNRPITSNALDPKCRFNSSLISVSVVSVVVDDDDEEEDFESPTSVRARFALRGSDMLYTRARMVSKEKKHFKRTNLFLFRKREMVDP